MAIYAIFGTVTENLRQLFGAVAAVLTVNVVSHSSSLSKSKLSQGRYLLQSSPLLEIAQLLKVFIKS